MTSAVVRAASVDAVRRLPPGRRFRVRVEGSSMEPALRRGDEVLADRTGHVRLGDLVVLDGGEAGLIVHRLLWRSRRGVRTRGDGSGRMDPPMAPDAVLGRVLVVERGGYPTPQGRWTNAWAWLRCFAKAARFRLGRRLAGTAAVARGR